MCIIWSFLKNNSIALSSLTVAICGFLVMYKTTLSVASLSAILGKTISIAGSVINTHGEERKNVPTIVASISIVNSGGRPGLAEDVALKVKIGHLPPVVFKSLREVKTAHLEQRPDERDMIDIADTVNGFVVEGRSTVRKVFAFVPQDEMPFEFPPVPHDINISVCVRINQEWIPFKTYTYRNEVARITPTNNAFAVIENKEIKDSLSEIINVSK